MKYIFFVEENIRLSYTEIRAGHWAQVPLPAYATEVLHWTQAWLEGEAHFTLHSSGTTGNPKPLLLHRSQLEASAHMGMHFFQIPRNLPLFLCLSVQHIAGIMQTIRALLCGNNLHVLPAQRKALQHLPTGRRYGLISLVPLQIQEALRTGSLSSLEQCHTVLVGGAPLFPSTEKALEGLKTRIYHSYGMSETAAHVALRRLHAPAAAYFEALPGVRLSRNKAGCLQIKAPATHYRLIETQDLVHMQSKGRFRWLGRADALINSGGLKLHLDELDRQLGDRWMQAAATEKQGFAFGLPDEQLGERLTWFVEQLPEERQLQRFYQSLKDLPKYHAPKSICVVNPFVLTESGKIDKKKTAQGPFKEIPVQRLT